MRRTSTFRRASRGSSATCAVAAFALLVAAAPVAARATAAPTTPAPPAPWLPVAHHRTYDASIGGTASFTLQGLPAAGVAAVVLSVSVPAPVAAGVLAVYPYGTARPHIASVSFAPGRSAVATVVVADVGGRVTVANSSGRPEPVVVTVVGYYPDAASDRAATAFVRLTQRRAASLALRASSAASFATGAPLTGVAGVVLSLTASAPSAAGSLVAYPAGAKPAKKSSPTFAAHRSATSLVVVRPGTRGRVTVLNRSSAGVRVWADVVGYLRILQPPSAPAGVTAVAGEGTALVSWPLPTDDGGAPVTGYRVVSSPGDAVSLAAAGASSVGVTGLTDGVAYTFTVVALNRIGASAPGGPSAPVTPRAPAAVSQPAPVSSPTPGAPQPQPAPLLPPTGVVATGSGPGQVTISWTAPASTGGLPVSFYQVTGPTSVNPVVATTDSVVINGLVTGQGYTFVVLAVTADGPSAPSEPSNVVFSFGTSRVSVGNGGLQGDATTFETSAISADGRYVAFASAADNFAPREVANKGEVYVRDRHDDTTTLVSVTVDGSPGVGISDDPTISADGRYVSFVSSANDLVSPSRHGGNQIYVRDMVTGTTRFIGTGAGRDPWGVLSADGSTIAWASTDPVLPSDMDDRMDVYVEDLASGVIQRASVATGGAQADGDSESPALSADGRLVAWVSSADDLVDTPVPPAVRQIYVHDMLADTTILASVTPPPAHSGSGSAPRPAVGDASSDRPCLSADGRFVAFQSVADNLAQGDASGGIFVTDTTDGSITDASLGPAKSVISTDNEIASISADGRYVSYDGTPNVANPTIAFAVYRSDLVTGAIVDVSAVPGQAISRDNISFAGNITKDGQHIAFESMAQDLVPGDTNNASDIFVNDLG